MRQDPFGNSAEGGRRRPGFGGGGLRLWVLLLFAGYGAYYWFSNRSVDAVTGEKVLIDKNLSIEDEEALGLQAYEEILSQERPVDPNTQIAREIRGIAQKLIAKVEPVEDALAAEHGLQSPHYARGFEWDVNVIQSEQANAFCLPGGKMAVYTGLVPVAQNADAMAVVMGHEIAHALLRHGAQRMAQQKLTQVGQMAGAMSGMDPQQQQMVMAAMGYGYLLPYARKHETEADRVGLMLAAAACFDPQAAIPLWERMSAASGGGGQPEFASTHPNPGTRIQNLQALMPQAMAYRAKFCSEAGSGASATTGSAAR
ncbi:MAG: M48 family metallopeptidase [Luteimonas sp.]|nr:M48 family metallopeptidase [Luteimonas sp.]